MMWLKVVTFVILCTNIVQPIEFRLSKHLDSEMAKCAEKSHRQNIMASIRSQVLCFQADLGQCLNFQQKRIAKIFVSRPICGVLNSGSPPIPTRWTIQVVHQFALYMKFIYFHLPSSYRCKISRLVVVVEDQKSLMDYNGQVRWLMYCGKRSPWHMTSRFSSASLTYSQTRVVATGFTLIMSYEAIDLMSTNIKVVHHITQFPEKQIHFVRFWNIRLSPIDTGLEIFQMVTFRNEIDKHSCLEFASTHYEVHIYDGPGSLSPTLFKGPVIAQRFCFTSFLGYVEIVSGPIKVTGRGKREYIEYAYLASANETLIMKYTSVIVITETSSTSMCNRQKTKDSVIFTASSSSSKTVHCNWVLEGSGLFVNGHEVNLHSFIYNGYDMLDEILEEMFDDQKIRPSPRVRLCQYGGFFLKIWYTVYPLKITYFDLCNTIKRNTLFSTDTTYQSGIKLTNIIFVTYPGYSDGEVSVEFKKASCDVFLYWGHMCSMNHNFFMRTAISLWRTEGKMHFLQTPKICGRLILTENMGAVVRREVLNCTKREMNGQGTMYFEGMVEMQIANTIVHFTQTPNDVYSASYYNLIVEIDTLADFPKNLSTTTHRFAVTRNKPKTVKLANIVEMSMMTNATLYDFHGRQVIVQIVYYLICFNWLTVYRIAASQSYVAIPIIPLKSVWKATDMTVRICTMRISADSECRTSTRSVRVDVRQEKAVYFYKILIYALRAANCSSDCSVLWVKYTANIGPRRSLYELVWNDTTLVEYTAAPTDAGFRLQINSSFRSNCSCDRQCPIIARFMRLENHEVPKLFSSEQLMPLDTFGSQLARFVHAGNLTVASWMDAAAECRKHGFQLITLMPSMNEYLKSLALSNILNLGDNQLGDVIFIGLYKANEVRILT